MHRVGRRRQRILFMIAGVCVTGLGCNDVSTTWSTEVRSPDGHWVATARTEEGGGFGTAHTETSVFLQQGTQAPLLVLGFAHDGPTINLKMKWVASRHFDVTYAPITGDSVSVDFQAIKIADVEISLEKSAALSP